MNKKEKLNQNIIKNSFWSLVSSLITRFGGLVLTVILARFLLPEKYGLYSIILSTAMIFFVFSDLGINMTLVRYLSLAIKKEKDKIYSYRKYLLKLKFILAITVSLLFFALSYPLAFYVFRNPTLFLPFVVASFYIFILSFETFHTDVFYSIEKIKYISIKESLSHVLKIVLVLGVFYFLASSYHLIGIFASFIIVSLSVIAFSMFYIKKIFPEFYLKSDKKINKKRVRRFVGFLTIASISTIFFTYIDSVMIGIFISPEFVGYYRAAFSIIFGIIGILSFANLVFLPVFIRLKEKGKMLNFVFKYISIITIPSVFGVIILGNYFIRILYGYSYLPAVLPFYFLSIIIFPSVAIGIFLSLFSSEEKPEIFAKLIIITSIINILLNLILIKSFLLISPLWATAGAAIATTLSWIIYFIAAVYAIKKQLNFSISFKVIIKPLIASMIMALILYYTLTLIKNLNLFLGLMEILLGILIYISVMLLIKGIKQEDLNLLRLFFKR